MALNESLATLDEATRELDSLRPLEPDVERRVFQRLRLEWNYHSNALEGNTLTLGETEAFLMHGLTAKGKPFKDYLDIKGHDSVIDVLKDLVAGQEPLTETLIRNLHQVLLVESYETPAVSADGLRTVRRVEVGRYKTTQNHVMTQAGKLHYFSSPTETPGQMQELVRWYGDELSKPTLHPVVFASVFHHRFVSIHPFDDGNGRLARILMNLILMRTRHVPAVIKAENKGRYLLALSEADAGDSSELCELIADSVHSSTKLYLKAAYGESIDDLDSFDMRLSLLQRSAQTRRGSGQDSHSIEDQNLVVQAFIAPLLRSIADRFRHVDPLFAERNVNLMCFADGHAFQMRGSTPADMVAALASSSFAQKLSKIQLFYSASGFVNDPERTFLCSVVAYFTPGQVAVTLQLTGKPVVSLYKGEIGDKPGEAEARTTAKTALEEFTGALQTVIG